MQGPHARARHRAEHRRRVQAALTAVLNDEAIMPNADCPDLVVQVAHVDFGATLNDILVDVVGYRRRPLEPGEESDHDRHMRQARARGDDTYIDLTDVCLLAEHRVVLESELRKRLGLAVTPRLRVLRHLGRGEGGRWRPPS